MFDLAPRRAAGGLAPLVIGCSSHSSALKTTANVDTTTNNNSNANSDNIKNSNDNNTNNNDNNNNNSSKSHDDAWGSETTASRTDSASGGLLEHVSRVLWNNRALCDVVLVALGREFHMHSLILCQSPRFRHLASGGGDGPPTPGCGPRVIELHVEDQHVTADGLESALGHLYGRSPELVPGNVAATLAAAKWLDAVELAGDCLDWISGRLGPENFREWFRFSESWKDGGRWRRQLADDCWAFLCRTAAREMRAQLAGMPVATVGRLLMAEELWVSCEAERFRLAADTLGPMLAQARTEVVSRTVEHMLADVVDEVVASATDGCRESKTCACDRQQQQKQRFPAAGDSEDAKEWRKGRKRDRWRGLAGEPLAKRTCLREMWKAGRQRGDCRSSISTNEPMGLATVLTGGSRELRGQLSDDLCSNSVGEGCGNTLWLGSETQCCMLGTGSTAEVTPQLSGSLNEAVDRAALIESCATQVLGENGVVYGAIGFGDLLQLREKLSEMDLPGVDGALNQGLWQKETLHSLVTFAALRDNLLQPNRSVSNVENLQILAYDFMTEQHSMATSQIPRLRFSVEFEDVESLGRKGKLDMGSQQIFFAGSLFRAVLSVHKDKENEQKMLGVYLHRSACTKSQFTDPSGFTDPRQDIDVSLKIIAGTTHVKVVELKGKIGPPHSNKGYSKMLPFNKLKNYLSPSGTLRITFIVSLLFDSQGSSDGRFVKPGM